MRKILLALAAAVVATLAVAPEAQAYYPPGAWRRGSQQRNSGWNSPRAGRLSLLPSPTIYAGREGWYFPGLGPLKPEDYLGPQLPAAGSARPR